MIIIMIVTLSKINNSNDVDEYTYINNKSNEVNKL